MVTRVSGNSWRDITLFLSCLLKSQFPRFLLVVSQWPSHQHPQQDDIISSMIWKWYHHNRWLSIHRKIYDETSDLWVNTSITLSWWHHFCIPPEVMSLYQSLPYPQFQRPHPHLLLVARFYLANLMCKQEEKQPQASSYKAGPFLYFLLTQNWVCDAWQET